MIRIKHDKGWERTMGKMWNKMPGDCRV